MTVIKKVLASRATLSTELDAALVTANGWTKVGSTYTSPTVDGRQLSFTFSDFPAYSQFVLPTQAGASRTLYLWHSTGAVAAQCDLTIHAGPDFFFIAAKGPGPSQPNANSPTFGSPRSILGMFPLVPFHVADTAKPWVAFGSSSNSTNDDAVAYVNVGSNGVGWLAARLATVRPAVQDVAGLGDSLQARQSNGLFPVWPYLVVETGSGLRGRLAHIYYASEGYLATGDTAEGVYAAGDRLSIDGASHTARRGTLRVPTTPGAYSPLGTSGVSASTSNDAADGGPIFFVKE